MPSPGNCNSKKTRRKGSTYSRTRCDSNGIEFNGGDSDGSEVHDDIYPKSRTSLWGGIMCMVSGLIVCAGSIAMTAIGYFAVELSLIKAPTTTTTTMPSQAATTEFSETDSTSVTPSPAAAAAGAGGLVTGINEAYLPAFQTAGPVLLGTGFFVMICAAVVIKEAISPTPPSDQNDDRKSSEPPPPSAVPPHAKLIETSSYAGEEPGPGWYRTRASSSIRRRFRRSHSDECINYARDSEEEEEDYYAVGSTQRRSNPYRSPFPPSPKVVVHRSFSPGTSSNSSSTENSENESLLGATAAASAGARQSRCKSSPPSQKRKSMDGEGGGETRGEKTDTADRAVRPKGIVGASASERELIEDSAAVPRNRKGLHGADGGNSAAHNNARHSRSMDTAAAAAAAATAAADEKDSVVVVGTEPEFNKIDAITPSDQGSSGDCENQLHYHSLTALASVEKNRGELQDAKSRQKPKERIEMRRLMRREDEVGPGPRSPNGDNNNADFQATKPAVSASQQPIARAPQNVVSKAATAKSPPSQPSNKKNIFIRKNPTFDDKDYGEVSQV